MARASRAQLLGTVHLCCLCCLGEERVVYTHSPQGNLETMVLPNVIMAYGPGLLTDELIKTVVEPVKAAVPLSFNP